MAVGFAGLGLMGQPMAANLCRAGIALTVYNRSPGPREALQKLGAKSVDTPGALFAACDTIFLMLANDSATDAVLDRGGPEFRTRVGGHLIINMGTHSPAFSQQLDTDVREAGGTFVEAPVSGSRVPAEAGELVAMLAGVPDALERARPLLVPMCREVQVVGAVPAAMAMKMAVNLYLVASVAALGEAANLAEMLGLDLSLFQKIIGAGPLRSDVAMAKLDKMARRDFTAQAAIRDVCKNAELVASTAAAAGASSPLIDQSRRLFDAASASGAAELDMAAVMTVFQTQSGGRT
jgi:3-hydroxyisobutyrate dehydrogenase